MTRALQAAGRPGILHLFAPYWGARQRWRAWLLVALWLSITLGSAWLYVRANELTGELTDALLGRQKFSIGAHYAIEGFNTRPFSQWPA